MTAKHLPPPLKIRCPNPVCRYEWMRVRNGVLRADDTLIRTYVCPNCGEKEIIVRKIAELPVFTLKRTNDATDRQSR